jgi:hypothetical protein
VLFLDIFAQKSLFEHRTVRVRSEVFSIGDRLGWAMADFFSGPAYAEQLFQCASGFLEN